MTDNDSPDSGDVSPKARTTLADKLSHLIAVVHPADRGHYSYREIAAGVEERTGVRMSAAYINQLATGSRVKARFEVIQALATFFGVPLDYFGDDETVTAKIDAQLQELERWREEKARNLAQRVIKLTPQAQDNIDALVNTLEQYQAQSRTTRRRRKPSTPDD